MDEKYGIVFTFLLEKEKYGNNRKREKWGEKIIKKKNKKKKKKEYHYNKSATHAFWRQTVSTPSWRRVRVCVSRHLWRCQKKHLNQ